MKILALDIGDKWIGVAISDSGLKYSFPFGTTTKVELVNFLVKTLKTEPISKIIYGLPKMLDNSLGEQAKKVIQCVEELQKNPVFGSLTWIAVDERFSSYAALEVLHQQNRKIKNNKLQEHAIAAAIVLESYLTRAEPLPQD